MEKQDLKDYGLALIFGAVSGGIVVGTIVMGSTIGLVAIASITDIDTIHNAVSLSTKETMDLTIKEALDVATLTILPITGTFAGVSSGLYAVASPITKKLQDLSSKPRKAVFFTAAVLSFVATNILLSTIVEQITTTVENTPIESSKNTMIPPKKPKGYTFG